MRVKHKIFITLVLLLISVAMNGQLYFKDGMKWCTKVGYPYYYDTSKVEVVTLEGTDEDGCLKMYCFYDDNISEKKMIALIKTEDEKAYFKFDDSETSQWYLMYDFGLNVGEGCYIYNFF